MKLVVQYNYPWKIQTTLMKPMLHLIQTIQSFVNAGKQFSSNTFFQAHTLQHKTITNEPRRSAQHSIIK